MCSMSEVKFQKHVSQLSTFVTLFIIVVSPDTYWRHAII